MMSDIFLISRIDVKGNSPLFAKIKYLKSPVIFTHRDKEKYPGENDDVLILGYFDELPLKRFPENQGWAHHINDYDFCKDYFIRTLELDMIEDREVLAVKFNNNIILVHVTELHSFYQEVTDE